VSCPRCGYENAALARFCSNCGAELVKPTSEGEERKLVSALFVDIVGSTARADDADPEDVRDFLRRYHTPLQEQIHRYGGTVEKFIGDAVVAIFGAPTSHGDDAERAVRCGLDIIETIRQLNAADSTFRLSVRVAVSTGEAVVTLGGAHQRGEMLATGDVLNTAARLQAAAPVNRVVVGPRTYEATHRMIEYDTMPAIKAKGKAIPIEAWLAIAPVAEPGVLAPMVGRDAELALLRELFEKVRTARRPRVMTVIGPAGIGKSRLTIEFLKAVDAAGGRRMRGVCLPYAEQAGYQASVQHIKGLAGVLESDVSQAARAKLAEMVASLLPREDVTDIARFLSLVIGLGVDEPVETRQPLFYAVRRLIEALCEERPTLFTFEDLHLSDASQIELLNYLCDQLRDVPAAFLITARPELEDRQPAFDPGRLEHTKVVLEPLSAADSELLVRAIAPPDNLPALVDMAGGNPLFLEELVATHGGAVLPTNVHEAIASHLDALPPEQRAALLDASVVGQTFWLGVVRSVESGRDSNLVASLGALAARGMIRRASRSVVAGEVQFSFKHSLVRDVAYQTLTRAARRARHATVAMHLEALPGLDLAGFATILAHHWSNAGENRKAIEYLLIAAERASAAWAREEMAALYQSAIDLAGDQDPELRRSIALKRGLASVRLTDFEAGRPQLEQLLPELEGRDQVEALMGLVWSSYWQEDVAPTLSFADRAAEMANRVGEPDLIAPAMAYRGLSREVAGELREAYSIYEDARRSWVPGTRLAELAMVNESQSDLAYWMGDHVTAERLARAAYELGGEAHSIQPILRGGAWTGLTMAGQGRTEEAIEWLDAIFIRAHDMNPRWGAATLNYSSLAFRDMFMFDEARRRNEQALFIVATRGAWGMPELEGEIDLMFTDLAVGEYGRAQENFPRLWNAAINGKAWRPWLGGTRLSLARAQLAHLTEDAMATAEHARDALERASNTHRKKYVAGARAVLGWALIDLRQEADGLAHLRAAVELADVVGSPTPRWQHRVTLARALYATGNDDGAAAAWREASDVVRSYAGSLTPDHARTFLNAEPVHEVIRTAGSG
jgi:class 3 adenylate cyclase/tetratricopeptide (TPR) repeat protein